MNVGIGAAFPAAVRPETFGLNRDAGPAKIKDIESAVAGGVDPRSRASASASVQPASEDEKAKNRNDQQLTEEEQRQVTDLKRRDAEVRAHEQAHSSAGGSYTGAPSFEYTTGPDGKRYAVSGEVAIDTSPVRDNPEATIRKMDVVIRAALAPSDPSSQDLQVARAAQDQRTKAQAELAKKRQAERDGKDSEDAGAQAPGEASPIEEFTSSQLLAANAAYGAGEESGNDLFGQIIAAARQAAVIA